MGVALRLKNVSFCQHGVDKLDSDQEPGGSGLYLARKSQVILVIRIEKSTMEWYSVDKCGYQRVKPVAGLRRGSRHRKKGESEF